MTVHINNTINVLFLKTNSRFFILIINKSILSKKKIFFIKIYMNEKTIQNIPSMKRNVKGSIK